MLLSISLDGYIGRIPLRLGNRQIAEHERFAIAEGLNFILPLVFFFSYY